MRRVLAATLALALGPAAAGEAATRNVVVRDLDFRASVARIATGDSVRWLFRDAGTSHNVISRGTPRFRSSPSQRSGSYSVRFRKAGTYRYRCSIHPFMTGRVVVG